MFVVVVAIFFFFFVAVTFCSLLQVLQVVAVTFYSLLQVVPGTFLELKRLAIAQSQTQQYKLPRVIRKPDQLELLWSRRVAD